MEARAGDKCRGWVGFSVKMAHRITAGADLLLMPSRFEPCGLNQLYAMAYGTGAPPAALGCCSGHFCSGSVEVGVWSCSQERSHYCSAEAFVDSLLLSLFVARLGDFTKSVPPHPQCPSCMLWAACVTRSSPSTHSRTRAQVSLLPASQLQQ
jgi:hypothetical protein